MKKMLPKVGCSEKRYKEGCDHNKGIVFRRGAGILFTLCIYILYIERDIDIDIDIDRQI